MKNLKKSAFRGGLFFVCLVCLCSLVSCTKNTKKDIENYPTKPITMICPWSEGGGTDAILRAFCKSAQKQLNSPIIVQNITGGGGARGHRAIKDATPDGYTMGMITFELNSLPPQHLVDFTYADFDPLTRVNADAATLTVRQDAPYNTVKEFVDYCKQNPLKITVGNSAPGSVWHIGAGLFAEKTGIKIKHTAFEGAAGAVSALISGYVDAISVSFPEVKAQVDAGKVKVLGVMAQNSPDGYPDVKTFKQQGFDIEYSTWRGIALPHGVDPRIKDKLVTAFTKAQEDAEFVATAKSLNLDLAFLPPKEFASFIKQNYAQVASTMASIGLIK